MLNSYRYSFPSELASTIDELASQWSQSRSIARIWEKDASVWTGGEEGKWLGWLTIAEEELDTAAKYDHLQNDVDQAGFKDVLLMGMGGSSLCPEVLAMTFGRENFHILDSTVPSQVASIERRLDLEKTLFIVASKSGSTLEPNCFKQYFFERLVELVGRDNAGRQFIAITDPGSKMEQIARDDGFRHVMIGKPDIGGRFSALSAFGMTAAAVMGLDIRALLGGAVDMARECRQADPKTNPGASLGLALGAAHSIGRDKLTIRTGREISDLGAWLEQLVAESTGKQDVAIIPVDREPMAESYGDDRFFVFLTVGGDDAMSTEFDEVTEAGHPAVMIDLESINDLGQEFFRWEFATAVAGAVMGIDPFNQPDVESAKIETRKLTEEFEASGSLPDESPFATDAGISFFTSAEYARTLADASSEGTGPNLLNSHLKQVVAGDYFAILAYVEMNERNERMLAEIRALVLERTGVATCLGFGPRFLHSTGQAYKGGGNNGMFLQIGADDEIDLQVPGQKYTFGTVKESQARGDFQVLLDRDRRALRVQLGTDVEAGLSQLLDWIS